MTDTQTFAATVCLLIAPLAGAGLAAINAGLGRARNAAYSMLAALCAIAVAAGMYFICGRALQGFARFCVVRNGDAGFEESCQHLSPTVEGLARLVRGSGISRNVDRGDVLGLLDFDAADLKVEHASKARDHAKAAAPLAQKIATGQIARSQCAQRVVSAGKIRWDEAGNMMVALKAIDAALRLPQKRKDVCGRRFSGTSKIEIKKGHWNSTNGGHPRRHGLKYS